MIKSRLKPLTVPWQISSSDSSLSFAIESSEHENYGVVRFNGFLGNGTQAFDSHGEYAPVTVLLKGLVASDFYPEYSDEQRERLDSYDWSLIPEFRDENGSLSGSTERFHCKWNETNLCPEPAGYRVENSPWVAKLRLDPQEFQHFVFVSEDFTLEVVAREMNWRIGNLQAV